MKKAIIVRATGGELTNQLWNYASIYAYCLERGYALANPAFFEYGNYFTIPAPNLFFKLFFFLPFTDYTKRKSSLKRKLWRKVYEYYAKVIISTHKRSTIISDNSENKPLYLPPTAENENLSLLEKTTGAIYFDGWLFRNPAGIQKYRKEILEYFKPRQDIEDKIKTQIKNIRDDFKNVVGVHIRQGDYHVWQNGKYFIDTKRTRVILDEYLKVTGRPTSETLFIITSDEAIDSVVFEGLNIKQAQGNVVEDLFLLSKTDVIIGSDSTYGDFAAYYGNIPHIVMANTPVDWEYYKDMQNYAMGKYMTWVHF